jgi:hypothetical protein
MSRDLLFVYIATSATGITYVCDSGCTHPFAQNAKGWGTINPEKRVGHPP